MKPDNNQTLFSYKEEAELLSHKLRIHALEMKKAMSMAEKVSLGKSEFGNALNKMLSITNEFLEKVGNDKFNVKNSVADSGGKLIYERSKTIFSPEDERKFRQMAGLGIVSHSAAMLNIYERVKTLAQEEIEIFIKGETGTGKTLIAKTIHKISKRNQKSFVDINCGGVPETLLESELFGIKKGAATDITEREGQFEIANGGTMFLDEICDMSPKMQGAVLKALDEKVIGRVGGGKEKIKIDVRFISASNKDIDEEINKGQFRLDLKQRIAKVVVELPPLRDRVQDIPYISEYIFKKHIGELKIPFEINPVVFTSLSQKKWEGNIRELIAHIQLSAIATRKHRSRLTPLLFKKIISNPEDYLGNEIPTSDEILRKSGDWVILDSFIETGFNVKKTAINNGINRDLVTRKVSSICLRLGNHFEFENSKIVDYLIENNIIDTTQTDSFINVLKKNFATIIKYENNPKSKKPIYNDELDMVKKLVGKSISLKL